MILMPVSLIGISPLILSSAALRGYSNAAAGQCLPRPPRACVQSVFYAFFSFISTSVAAPTLIRTPPASLATRSCSFSFHNRWSFVDLGADVLDPRLDRFGMPGTVDDRVSSFATSMRFRARGPSGPFSRGSSPLPPDPGRGKIGDSSSMALRRSPNPAPSRRSLENSRRLIYHQRRDAFFPRLLGMMRSGLPTWLPAPNRQQLRMFEIFLSCRRM